MRKGQVLDQPRWVGAVAAASALGGAAWFLVAVEEAGQLGLADVLLFPILIAAAAVGAFAGPRLRDRIKGKLLSIASSVVLLVLGLLLLPFGLPVLLAGVLAVVMGVSMKKETG